MADKEQIKAIIKQYADKGMNNFHKALKDDGKEAVTTKYWDGFSDCANLLLLEIDSMQEDPVSEKWIEELRTKLDSLSKEDFKKVFDKYAIDFNEDLVKDLEEAANEWDESLYRSDAFKGGANWQKQKDEVYEKSMYKIGINFGKEQIKQQMMKDAVEAVVMHRPNDYGEYDPYIHVRVSSEYKEGSKVKVIILKDEY